MKFKMVDGQSSFICEIAGNLTVADLYQVANEKAAKEVLIFRSMPRRLVEKSSQPVADVLADMECLYLEGTADVKGPSCSANGFFDQGLSFSVLVVPSDNSCLFHSLSEVLNARSSGELRKMVANKILQDPNAFAPFIEKEPFAYTKWITSPEIWGGAPEITIISKIYETKVCVIDRALQIIEFGEEFRSVVYLMYSGTHYNAVVAHDRSGNLIRKFPRGDTTIREAAQAAVKRFFNQEARADA